MYLIAPYLPEMQCFVDAVAAEVLSILRKIDVADSCIMSTTYGVLPEHLLLGTDVNVNVFVARPYRKKRTVCREAERGYSTIGVG